MISPSQWAFLAVFALVAIERIVELFVSKRNAQAAFDRGGKEYGQGHFGVMKALHTSFLFAAPAEVLVFDRPFIPWLFGACLVGVVGTMVLRYWAITSLDGRWNTRVIVVPGAPAVTGGPYRFLRHPNYVAVVLELALLPLMHGAWLTAAIWGVANLILLRVRIQCEEQALADACEYEARMGDRSRFVPGLPPSKEET